MNPKDVSLVILAGDLKWKREAYYMTSFLELAVSIAIRCEFGEVTVVIENPPEYVFGIERVVIAAPGKEAYDSLMNGMLACTKPFAFILATDLISAPDSVLAMCARIKLKSHVALYCGASPIGECRHLRQKAKVHIPLLYWWGARLASAYVVNRQWLLENPPVAQHILGDRKSNSLVARHLLTYYLTEGLSALKERRKPNYLRIVKAAGNLAIDYDEEPDSD